MVQIKKDKFVLGQSAATQLDPNNKKIKMNIQLQLAAAGGAIAASVSGKVIDSSNGNVSGALVSIMDANYEPLINAVTDASGNYAFAALPVSNNYSIFAVAAGKQLNQGTNFTIAAGSTVVRNFTLANETSAALGVIVGDVIKTGTTTPVSGGVVTLHSSAAGEALTAVAYTNDFGQYAFREVPIGNYFIQINALGYVSKRVQTVNIATAGQILSQDITLDADANAAKGTISGVITDNGSNPIPRADCVLYSVAADGALTAVAYNKTNPSGVYLFTNVAQGNYRVKSNFMETIDYQVPGSPVTPPPPGPVVDNFTRPNLDKFTISQATTVIPIKTHANTGTLAGGAVITAPTNAAPGFVDFLGGNSQGSTTITVNAAIAGSYTVAVYYVTTSARNMLVDVNGVATGTTYNVPATPTFNAADARLFYFIINLNAGSNSIKFYGPSGATYAPVLGGIEVVQNPYNVVKASSTFTLAGGANLNASNGYILAIGNVAGGSATTTVNAGLGGEYTCQITYFANTNRPLRVDVNGTFTGTTHSVPTGAEGAVFSLPVNLTTGNNTVKFYNSSTTEYAPDIKQAVFTQTQYANLQEAETTTLAGTAAVSGEFVTGLSSSDAGNITMTKTVPYTGVYDLTIAYVSSSSDAKVKLTINGTVVTNLVSFEQTATMTIPDKKTVTVRVNLNAGSNTIKIN